MTQMTLPNSSNHKLINFNVPTYLINNFDNLVRYKRMSRTSMLIHLIESYVREETQQLKSDNNLNELLTTLEIRNQNLLKEQLKRVLKTVKEEEEPPMIPNSRDHQWTTVDEWGDNFWRDR